MLTFDEASIDRYTILKEFAHKNRLNMTMAERILWDNIRQNQLGHKFLRQYIVGDYIVDFACRDDGLIIEVDGAYHSETRQAEDDAIRENWLTSHGYHILRFTNEEIYFDLDNVLSEIKRYLI